MQRKFLVVEYAKDNMQKRKCKFFVTAVNVRNFTHSSVKFQSRDRVNLFVWNWSVPWRIPLDKRKMLLSIDSCEIPL